MTVFLAFLILMLIARGIVWLMVDSKRTPDEVVMHTLMEKHKRAPNPRAAADDEVSMFVEMEDFRRFASSEYVAKGTDLAALKTQWLSSYGKMLLEVFTISRGAERAAQFVKRLKASVFAMTVDDVFCDGPAAAKWAAYVDHLDRTVTFDDVAKDDVRDCVMHGLYANRRNL